MCMTNEYCQNYNNLEIRFSQKYTCSYMSKVFKVYQRSA